MARFGRIEPVGHELLDLGRLQTDEHTGLDPKMPWMRYRSDIKGTIEVEKTAQNILAPHLMFDYLVGGRAEVGALEGETTLDTVLYPK